MTRHISHDLRDAAESRIDELTAMLLPVYVSCYPRATAELLRYSLTYTDVSINRLTVYLDKDGVAVGYNHLVLQRGVECSGRRFSIFRDDSVVSPTHRGKLPVTRDMAHEALKQIIGHPFEDTIYISANSLPGYHFIVRNSFRAYPCPWRPTPPGLEQVLASLGPSFFANEPGSLIDTGHPLVLGNELLAAPEEQEEWIRTHRDLLPELTEFYLALTGGRPDRFVLTVVPGTWTNLIMTTLSDGLRRARRFGRRLFA